MNLLSQQAASPGGDNNAGAVCNSAASAHPHYTVGEVGFGRSWQDEEPGLRALYEEAQAQIAIYEVERGILEKEMRRLREEVANNRVMRLDWRDCAKRLAAAVQYYHPQLREEPEGGWSEERAAIALFDELEAAE